METPDLQEQQEYHSCFDPVLEEILVKQLRAKGYFIRHGSRSYVVDLNQVSTKLLDWATEVAAKEQERREKIEQDEPVPPSNCSTPLLVPRSESFSPLSPEAQHQEYMRFERQRHDKLVKDGGRPWYPIDLIDPISRNPRDYHGMLRYWQGDFPEANQDLWMIFGYQLHDWKKFRVWQAEMRKHNKCSFPRYVKQTKARVAAHSKQPDLGHLVNVHKNPKKQDQLSTWLEYYSYQIRAYADFSWYKSWEPRYEDAWRNLVNSRHLRQGDTRNYVESDQCADDREEELLQRREIVEIARSKLMVAEQDIKDPAKKGPATDMQMLRARREFDGGIADYYTSKFRDDSIDEYVIGTVHYRLARRRGVRHEILLGWIQHQIPFVQVEMAANMNPRMTNHVYPVVVDPALVTVEPNSPAPAPALAHRPRPTQRIEDQQPNRPPPVIAGRVTKKTASTSPRARRPQRNPRRR